MIHWLKTDTNHFQHIWDGSKNYEVRQDDRNYQEYDILILAEGTDLVARAPRAVIARVKHRMGDNQPGVSTGFVTLGLQILGRISEDDLHLYNYMLTKVESEEWYGSKKVPQV